MIQAVQGPRYHVVYDKEEHDSYLLLGNLHRVPEHRPEHSGVAGRCSQGPHYFYKYGNDITREKNLICIL